ncbi:MAG: DNA polymerase, partial [Planctomycetota bacterium]
MEGLFPDADAPAEEPEERRLFLLDGTALAYRAFHAMSRSRLTDRSGRPSGAIYGFTASVFRLLREEKPDHLAVCFDPPGPTFRHERYEDYKATREKMPEELVDQMPRLREVTRALGFPVLEVPGWEADDVLATVAHHASSEGARVFLVTGDKDLFQLVDDRVSIYNILTKGGQPTEVLDADGVEKKFGVPPKHVADVLALMGDSSDNVPGVPGIGPKTAIKLVMEFGGLEDVLKHADDVKRPKTRESLKEFAEQARLSYELVKIPVDAPVEFSFDDATVSPLDMDVVRPLFEELDFRRFLAELPKTRGAEADEERTYRTVESKDNLDALVKELEAAPRFSFDTETTGIDALQCDLVGLSFSTRGTTAWYVPCNSESPLFGGEPGSDTAPILDALRGVLEDPGKPKCGQNSKYDLLVLRAHGVTVRGVTDDTMVLSFLVDPQERTHNLDDLALRHLNIAKVPTSELIGKGRDQITMADVPVEKVAEYACEDADVTFRLLETLEQRLEESGTEDLYRSIEVPLVDVLTDMEERGIRVDVDALHRMSEDLRAREDVLIAEVEELAGEPFNIRSTQQLGNILFEKLKVQGRRKPRRTKTGYATNVEALEPYKDHPLVE